MKQVYVGGAHAGNIKENTKAVVRIAALVNDAGAGKFFAICPHPMGNVIYADMDSEGESFATSLRQAENFWLDGTMLMLHHCDFAIFRHSPESAGVAEEIKHCELFNIPYTVIGDEISLTGMKLTLGNFLK